MRVIDAKLVEKFSAEQIENIINKVVPQEKDELIKYLQQRRY